MHGTTSTFFLVDQRRELNRIADQLHQSSPRAREFQVTSRRTDFEITRFAVSYRLDGIVTLAFF
jgi:hypothetical protein